MIYIRTDANRIIASGHIMRCIAIASNLRLHNIESVFLISDDTAKDIIESNGFSYVILDTKWDDINIEVSKVVELVEHENPDLLLIDTYSVTEYYVLELAKKCRVGYIGSKTIVMSELSLLINYDVNIDYTFYKNNYDENRTQILLGPQYAPLRSEFVASVKPIATQISRVLITTGNTNQGNVVGRILQEIIKQDLTKNIVFDVIVGNMYDSISDFESLRNENVVFHHNVPEVSSLMKQCDIAIAACGTMVYELIALSVPVISFSMVPEQIKTAEKLDEMGIITYCGKSYISDEPCIEKIIQALMYFILHPDEMTQMARIGSQYIDGNGNERIYEAILDTINN